jgi:hypothetical protein
MSQTEFPIYPMAFSQLKKSFPKSLFAKSSIRLVPSYYS